tara:strand:+ start:220 stop:387 length:168 start_codon:yes stop_codon:yes gene_type:complete
VLKIPKWVKKKIKKGLIRSNKWVNKMKIHDFEKNKKIIFEKMKKNNFIYPFIRPY